MPTTTWPTKTTKGILSKFQFEVNITEFLKQHLNSNEPLNNIAIFEEFVVGKSDVILAVEVTMTPDDFSIRLIRRYQRFSAVRVFNCFVFPRGSYFTSSDSKQFKATTLVAGSDVIELSTVSLETSWNIVDSLEDIKHSNDEPARVNDDGETSKIIISGSIFYETPRMTLQEEFRSVPNEPRTGDVEIIVQRHKFPAHKFWLAARSSFFKRMFNSNMKENLENVIKLPEEDPEVFEQVLHYIYADTCPELTSMAVDLLIAADKYDLQGLRMLCEDEMMKTMNTQNVCDYFVQSGMVNYTSRIYNKCIDFILKNSKMVTETEGWIDLIDMENSGRYLVDIIERLDNYRIIAL